MLVSCIPEPEPKTVNYITHTYIITYVYYYKYKKTEKIYVNLKGAEDGYSSEFDKVYVTNTFHCQKPIMVGDYVRLTLYTYERNGKEWQEFDYKYLENCLCNANCKGNK
jgi:hypothetical protein